LNPSTPERAAHGATPSPPPTRRPKRWLLGAPLAPLILALALALVWYDVLPGGWRLRGWVVPHAERQAREQAQHSAERMALFTTENLSIGEGAIVFLGSSTVESFPLETAFPNRPILDRGIAGETAGELLARLHESLPATEPVAALVYGGSLDFRRENAPPAEVTRRVKSVLVALRARVPDLPIALIGILPERDMDPPFVGRLIRTNRRLNALATEMNAAFVSTERPPITACDGSLAEAYSTDRWHLNSVGYEHLAAWILRDGGEVGLLLAPH
jgi:lysophospholipase L1-like esterase